MVGNWLYGVAHQTALKAKATLAKRRTRERQVDAMPEIEVEPQHFQQELRAVLDQELSRLPDKYRVAIVLCDLEGRTRIEAARQLAVPPGTLAARLTRGRALLAKRLVRHNLAVSGGILVAALSEQAASANQPAALVSSTIRAVTSIAAGRAASAGVVSAPVAALTEGMVKAMFLSKVKIATGIVLALTVSMAGGLLYKTQAGDADDAPRVEQRTTEDARAAAIKAVEQFGKSDQDNDREAAIKALTDYRRELKAAEQARQRRNRARELTDLFQFRVPIEIGVSESQNGGRIDIVEVRGTRPRIEVGGQYLVRGKCKLPKGERSGKIYFFRTATEGSGVATILDLDSTEVNKQEGEFTLIHAMSGAGHLHLVLSDPERYSRMFANVYFGTGDNVLRKKSW